jgi:hypothetical protein
MMSTSVTATYPKLISISQGSKVEVHGWFTRPDQILATQISDDTKGVSYALTPDEVRASRSDPDRPAPTSLWRLPLVGQVVSCLQYGEVTILGVFPSDQKPLDYNQECWRNLGLQVPAFVRQVEEKRASGSFH